MLAGQFVTCLTRKYTQLQFGIDYQIERVTRIGSLKFVGYGHLYDRKNFALVREGMPVHVPVAKPKPAPVIKKTLAQELIEKVDRAGGAGTCSYAIEFASGHRRFQSNDACHARMRWGKDYGNNDKDGDKPVAVACNIHGHIKRVTAVVDFEAYKVFVKYMLNDSPWADAWLTKDVDEAMKGCAMMDVTKHFSYVCSAAIALRTGSEYPRFLKVFKQLIDMKYSPHVAYIMSQMTTVGNNGSYDITGQGGSHHVFHNHMELDKVVAFFDNKKINIENAPYNESEKKMYTIFKTIAEEPGFKHGKPSILSTITNANKEFVYVNKTGWSNYETVKAKDFNEYLKIVNTFARNFK
jgi:hypothetical protein